jgi:ribose transport system ATP-binding protein
MLAIEHISKTFPGVKALTDVSFSLEKGEIHALCGENGAGKSTLTNILAGNLQPDPGGRILLDGAATSIRDFNHARELGIGIVYQERSLADTLNVAENIFANRAPANRWGWIDSERLFEETRGILDKIGLGELSPKMPVQRCSPAQKQLIEIGKALSQNPRLLMLDEPTTALGERETAVLFGLMTRLKAAGVTIVYISHRLAEIFKIADRVTVLKDGAHQMTAAVSDTTPAQLIRRMVGRDLDKNVFESAAQAEVLLKVENLSTKKIQDINITVRKGEITALAGLAGSGRSEVARAIVGADPKTGGIVQLEGQKCNIHHPSDAIRQGIVYLPEDRKQQAIFPDMSVAENIYAGVLGASAAHKTFEVAAENDCATRRRDALQIKTPSIRQPIRLLSGGNQQKAVLARWLELGPKILMIDEPTQGVDVGAKFEIHRLLRALAATGAGILLISSELPEVLSLADRIWILREGRIAGELTHADATEEKIMAYASGLNP